MTQTELYDAIINLTTGKLTKQKFAQILCIKGMTWFTNEAHTQIDEEVKLLLQKKDIPWEEEIALRADAATSRIKSLAMERCDTLFINRKRLEKMLDDYEKNMFSIVDEKWRRQFGMNQ